MTDDKSHVFDLMQDKVRRRREAWHTEETPILPPPEWMNETTIISRYSRTGLETRRRFLLDNILIRVTEDARETPSAIARDYLICKYKCSPKWTSSQRDRIYEELVNQPLYCNPSQYEDGYYIDLAGAYWSVMVRCGWDVNYYPSRWVSPTLPPLDFPYSDNKRARSCLVSVARALQISAWSPERGNFQFSGGNPRSNNQLYTLIQDCLNGIACEAIEAGAVYVFGDGYIAPSWSIAQKIMQITLDWGFTPRIKGEGRGFVNALGSYSIGSYHTKGVNIGDSFYHSVKKLDYHNWLRDRMGWARSRSEPYHDNFVMHPIAALRYQS